EEDGTLKRRAWWVEAITPAHTLALDYAKSHGQKVAEVMSDRVISANEDTPLSEMANSPESSAVPISSRRWPRLLPSPPRIPSRIAASVRPSWRGSLISPGPILASA